jgi:hypothetical protein
MPTFRKAINSIIFNILAHSRCRRWEAANLMLTNW